MYLWLGLHAAQVGADELHLSVGECVGSFWGHFAEPDEFGVGVRR